MEGSIPTLDDGNPEHLKTFHTSESSSTLLEQSLFPETWKKEKQCCVCEVKLTTGRGDSQKRHGCKFCCHAVCKKCSSLRWGHAVTARAERICTNCFRAQVETQLKADLLAQQSQRDADFLTVTQKVMEEMKRRKEVEDALTLLRDTHNQCLSYDKELRFMTEKAKKLEVKLASVESDFSAFKLESAFQEKKLETSILALQQNVEKNRKILTIKVTELFAARKQLEQYKKITEKLQETEVEKQPSAGLTPGLSLAVTVSKQLHAMEKAELTAQLDDIKAKHQQKLIENDLLTSRLRDSDTASNANLSSVLAENQETLRRLNESEKEKAALNCELLDLRSQLERLTSAPNLDATSAIQEVKLDAERRIKSIREDLQVALRENEDLRLKNESFTSEVKRLTEELDEHQSLLSLAKDDILTENQAKTEIAAELSKYETLRDQLLNVEWLSNQVLEQSENIKTTESLISRQRLEIEQYKFHLKSCQEALEKCEEMIRAAQERQQLERRLMQRRDAEIEMMRKLLESNGLERPGSKIVLDSESDLTLVLKEKEDQLGKLGAEFKETMLKMNRAKQRRSRPSNDSRSSLKPPLSTEPCACALF